MRLILSALIFVCVPFSALESQVPDGIRNPKGLGPVLVGFEQTVYRGEDNRIELSKGRRDRKIVVYSIWSQPRAGKLTLNPNTGVATYKVVDKGIIDEHFEFRVREAGIGDKGTFSAAVKVNLKIADRAARLEFPKTIDFGKVVIGEQSSQKLIIKNKGDADFRGKVSLPHGFQVNGKEEVELNVAVGVPETLKIKFLGKKKPEKDGVFFQLQKGMPGSRVNLVYDVRPPFQVDDEITLKFDDESYTRNTELRISNPFGDKVKVQLMLPDRLDAEHIEHEIAGNSTKPVKLNIPSHHTAEFDDEVIIIVKGFSKTVRVFAEECPARVVVEGMKEKHVLRFKGIWGAAAEDGPDGFKKNIKLRNVGGRSANLLVQVNPPFHIIGGAAPREIMPGESLTYSIELRPKKVGDVAENLNIAFGGKPLVISLQGQVEPPAGVDTEQLVPPPEWRGKKGRNESAMDRLALRELLYGRNETDRRFNSTVPPVRKIRIIEQRSESLVISWQIPAGGDWKYVLEALVSLRDERTGLPVQTWVEIKPEHLTITMHEAEVRAEIVGIVPGGEFQFRIFTMNSQGDFSSPATLRLAIQGKAGFFEWFRIWMLPLSGLVLAMILSAVRRIRHERQLYG